MTMCETGCARVGSGGGAGPRPLAGKGQKRKRARQWERKGRGREGGEGLEEGSQYLKAGCRDDREALRPEKNGLCSYPSSADYILRKSTRRAFRRL